MFYVFALFVGFWFGGICGAWLVVAKEERGPGFHDRNYEANIKEFFAEHRHAAKLRRVK